ncbi:chemotaxis protein CheW [Sandaracinus amylolyticus]|uniref:chemotaxis protein CheW n=1 Tax=Sandaracinus amylolyticus TaxID=927083 RepID=UPI001F33F4AE|nr:chemotaxis protein CheW [Sandaracinus amylolyticus]UJR82632.1 Hypothetical protein I5071_46970 [Sandaracinus amylolyticus]
MTDPLSRFREDLSGGQGHAESSARHRRALLLFEHGGALLGVPAESVDAVIAWQAPARLPCATAGIAGVVQDRGRIVAVLESPLGESERETRAVRRLIVCGTTRGFVGIPAETTRGVSTVELARDATPGELVDSSEGPLTIVDPIALISAVRETTS